jgi:6-pyruvoyltetrahydropterin/6-carboxytetrahydropterin synthase
MLMNNIRVTKEFNFEMAHALWNYDGPCRNIHGHSYKLYVTVTGCPEPDVKSPKQGMVIDFGDLKKIVREYIIDRFDHAVVVNQEAPKDFRNQVDQMFEKYEVVDYQPTCENLVLAFAQLLDHHLPEGTRLHHLRLDETGTSFAEWYAEDNQRTI